MNPWRQLFPLLKNDPGLAYLDSAASTQKFQAVLDAERAFYERDYANVHRGVYRLAERATAAYEDARKAVARFFNARSPRSIVFTRGATESLNLVVRSLGETLDRGDEIILSELEHHANMVPWLMLKERKNIVIRYWPIDAGGALHLDALQPLLSERTKLVSFTAQSNVTGQRIDVPKAVSLVHSAGAIAVVDAAQAAAHGTMDLSAWDADLVAVSGHKVYGPMGSGFLYGKESLLERMPPFQGGGDMIASVRYDGFAPAEIPHKFEAGTPSVAQAVGFVAALGQMESLGRGTIAAREESLARRLYEVLGSVPGAKVLSSVPSNLASFVLEGIHPHDVAQFLDSKGIAVRAGHHCAQPLLRKLGYPATVRASLGLYNDETEIDRLGAALAEARRYFA
jgi:cysteine desulfurase/selenocysteine lyase